MDFKLTKEQELIQRLQKSSWKISMPSLIRLPRITKCLRKSSRRWPIQVSSASISRRIWRNRGGVYLLSPVLEQIARAASGVAMMLSYCPVPVPSMPLAPRTERRHLP